MNDNLVVVRLDAICDEFELQWTNDTRPDFESFLARIDTQHRATLLELLLKVDLELRNKAGHQIHAEDYRGLGERAVAFVDVQLRLTLRGKSKVSKNTSQFEGERIGPFKLLQQIGEGGMGTVWMADQEFPIKRRVALKVIKAGMDSKQVIARFDAERQALALMDHQNIAKVIDAGMTGDGRPYFAMELVKGIPLTEYCDANRLSLQERLELFVPVCSAVQHAHQKGIIHRDLKPTNVLVALYDGNPVPKVIDFGLAKALQHQSRLTDKSLFTEFGQVVGTVQYMSPEQAEMNALDVDTRTDVYSLGVMLYELLTGSTPIEKETLKKEAILKVLETIREKDPPRPSVRLSSSTNEAVMGISAQRQIEPIKLKSILRGDLDWIVMKALEKDRTRRYETANGLAVEIERFLAGEPVQARPPSAGYRLSKYVKRHKGLVTSLTSLAALLILGIISSTWFGIQANIQRNRADQKTTEVKVEKDRADQKATEATAQRTIAEQKSTETQIALDQSEATLARSNYFLANARWNENRAAEAMELLHRIPVKLRNVEWFLDRRLYEGGDVTLYGHQDYVYSVAFSPDGTRLASGSLDNTIKLWDAKTGAETYTATGHKATVSSVAFSPDGTRLASGSWDNTIKLWDAKSGVEIRTLTGHKAAVSSVAFSPDGTCLASGSGDKTIKLWDLSTGAEVRTLAGNQGAVSSVAFSPDGTCLASGSWDNTIKMWDAKSGAEIHSLTGHQREVLSVAFSPEGTRLASASGDKTIRLWDVGTGAEILSLTGHQHAVSEVVFSPDGTRLASASRDFTFKLWDPNTSAEIRSHSGHQNAVLSVAFSPDGTRLASASADKTIKLWDVNSGAEFRSLTGHHKAVSSVAFSPKGTCLASGSSDNTIKLWDTKTGSEIRSLSEHLDYVSSVAFSPDGTRLASGSGDTTIKLWDANTGAEIHSLTGHQASVFSVAFSPDGIRVASGAFDTLVKLWDARTGVEIRTLAGHKAPVSSVAFSPDGIRLASGSWDNTIKMWDAKTGEEIYSLTGHQNAVRSVAFSPDGTRLASGSMDYTIKIWDTNTGAEIYTLTGHPAPLSSVAFSSDGSRLVSGSQDKTIKLWDAKSGAEIRTLNGHQSWVFGVTFSPDGTHLVSASRDKTINLRDAKKNEEIRWLNAHSDHVESVSFSPDGTRIYSKDSLGNQLVWNTETGETLPNERWNVDDPGRVRSPDGRWLVTSSQNAVIVVDLEFKNTPDEQAYREFKARPMPWWHREQAESAEKISNWYSATFHWACLLKSNPEQAVFYDSLHAAHTQWRESFKMGVLGNRNPDKNEGTTQTVIDDPKQQAHSLSGATEPDILVQPIVREMLLLPRGTKMPVLTAFDASQINIRTWSMVKSKPSNGKPALTLNELSAMQNVCQEFPLANYFNTLGTAEYRMGNFQAAFETCSRSLPLLPQEMKLPGPHPGDLAILAMSQFKLGAMDEARQFREQFFEAMKHEQFKEDPECKSIQGEVLELFETESKSVVPDGSED